MKTRMLAAKGPRQGVVYLVVLMSSLIVASIALSAIETARWLARSEREHDDALNTLIAADAALEYALARINADASWRNNHVINQDTLPVWIGDTAIVYRLQDLDGSLTDSANDSTELIVTASRGTVKFSWQATLETRGDAINCLDYSVAAGGNIRLHSPAVAATDDSFASDGQIYVSGGASLTANCFAKNSISGNVYGSAYSLSDPLDLPSDSIMEDYRDLGTEIQLSDLTYSSGFYRIEKQLLADSANTITGQLDPNGVYFIDCAGSSVAISQSRLRCTLVLINPGSNSIVEGSVHWEAAKSNYPILLIDGKLMLATTRTPLRESDAAMNFNPSQLPFRGMSDNTTSGVYPSQLRGLIYASGSVTFSESAEVELHGSLITGARVTGSGKLFVQSREIFNANPPPGFHQSQNVYIRSGSVRRVAAPD